MRIVGLAPIAVAALLSGCGYFGAIDFPTFGRGKQAQAPAADPAPAGAVETGSLPPLDGQGSASALMPPDQPGGLADDPLENPEPVPPGAPGATASAGAAPAGSDVGRSELLGGWTVTSGNESCQLFMTLTTWTGGYRASTRGCSSDQLKSISAWNLNGKEIVLAGLSGAPVARLTAAGGNRFDGQTETGGAPISFYR